MTDRRWTKSFRAPLDTPVSDIFIDESDSKASRSRFFALGLVKVRDSGTLLRSIEEVRGRHGFRQEFKFSSITRDSLPAYLDVVEALGASDVRIGAYVFNKDVHDPFATRRQVWEVQSDCAARLVRGNANKGELLAVHLDMVTTPRGVSLAERVKERVNSSLKCMTVVSCLDLDSTSTPLLQMADLVASSIAYERRSWTGESPEAPRSRTPKGEVTGRLQRCFDLRSFEDVHEGRVNIKTARTSISQPLTPSTDSQ